MENQLRSCHDIIQDLLRALEPFQELPPLPKLSDEEQALLDQAFQKLPKYRRHYKLMEDEDEDEDDEQDDEEEGEG